LDPCRGVEPRTRTFEASDGRPARRSIHDSRDSVVGVHSSLPLPAPRLRFPAELFALQAMYAV